MFISDAIARCGAQMSTIYEGSLCFLLRCYSNPKTPTLARYEIRLVYSVTGGLKLLYASCFVDEFLSLDTETNFQRTLATLEAEVRDRDAHIQVVLKRFETFPPVTE